MKERDRLSLLLEINNHIVNKLEVNELFHAVARSMRKHFGNDAITFWFINKQSGYLERTFLDFPNGRGFLEKLKVAVLGNLKSEWWRLRMPRFYAPQQMPDLPLAMQEAAKAESLTSAVRCPCGFQGPSGPDEHEQPEHECFQRVRCRSAVANWHPDILGARQCYGLWSLRESRDDLEHQRLYLESELSSGYDFEDIVGKS